jgi:hypothetical protein
MAYLPKSKYTYKTAGDFEFVYQSNKKPFKGAYLELSNGTYREGKSILNIGQVIIPFEKPKKDNTYIIAQPNTGDGLDMLTINNGVKYSRLKENIKEKQDNYEPIIFSKPVPTVKEYKKGNFRRYFCLRINTVNDYKEITKKTYDSLRQNESKYDSPLHMWGVINWSLSDESSATTNFKRIKKLKRRFPNIDILFPDLGEYAIPGSLFKPKTQIEKIEEQNNPPSIPKGAKVAIPEKAKNPILEEVQKEAIAEVENINRKRANHQPNKRRKKTPARVKGLKNSLKHLKMFRKGPKGRSGRTSGGRGGGY